MKKNILSVSIIVLASVSLTGCTKIMMYAYGVRNPKIENRQSIIDYAKENDMGTDNLYAFRDSAALAGFYSSKIGMPEINFYNKDGNLMKYRNEKICNAQDDELIRYLDPKNVEKIDTSHNTSQIGRASCRERV